MRETKFQVYNEIDKTMIDWPALKALPILFMNIINGKVKHHRLRQYTGDNDENGVEIYEGDILSEPACSVNPSGRGCIIYKNRVIEWVSAGAGYRLFQPSATSEVVGNIYENPELLEKS